MANGALFIGWGPDIPGREQKALQVFDEAIQFYTRMQQQGQIASFEAVALEPHGGDLHGFLLVRGDLDKLAHLRTNDEFTRLNTRGQLVVQNLGVIGAYVGEELAAFFANFQKQSAELA